MSYFNFLSPDLEDNQDEQDTLPGSTPGPSEEYQPYPQRRGEKSSKVFETADRIIDRYKNVAGTTAVEDAKREVRANPDDAAKIVEKFYDTKARGQRIPDEFGKSHALEQVPQLYDKDFGDLEHHVRTLRTMKRGPEEKALTSELGQVDLQKNLNTIQSLKGQLDQVTKDIASQNLPEAVSARGEAENKRALAQKQQDAATLSSHIKQLEAQTAGQQPQQTEQVQAATEAKPEIAKAPDPTTVAGSIRPVGDYMDALGIDTEKLTDSVHKAMMITGVHPDKMDDPVPTHAGMLRVLSAMDPKGTFGNMLAQELADAKAKDQQSQQQSDAEGKRIQGNIQQIQGRIGQNEARMRELYAKLNETPFMQTWPGIFLYVITGMLVGPGIATKIFGNLDNRRAIGNELNSLKFDIRRLDHQLDQQERDARDVRSAALHRMEHREDRDLQYTRDIGKTILQHNLILARETQRHPDQANAYKQLGNAYVRERQQMQDAQHRKDEAQRILSNDFSDEKDKQKARVDMAEAEREVQTRKARAAAIDQTINKLGGISIGEEEGQ